MVSGATLHVEEPPHGIGVRRVGTEAVDGLGREGDESATTKRRDSIGELGVGDHRYQ